MNQSELLNLVIASAVLILVIGFKDLLDFNPLGFSLAIFFGLLIIIVNVSAKKFMARRLDAEVETKIWYWQKYGYGKFKKLKNPVPAGIILPLFITALSLGTGKVMTILSYETTALKRRASKRFGRSSFTEMTDKHTGLIGAAGIVAILVLSFVAYWIPGAEGLAKYAAFYAFWNLVPFSKLDGTKIFFGNRVQWAVLSIITLIFTAYAILLP